MTPRLNTIVKFYTTDELAGMLSISKITVYRLVETRKIPFYKIKGCIRFSEMDILNFLESSRVNEVK